MKREPVILTREQRILIVRLIVESLHRRNFDVPVACVTDVHFHVLARFRDHNPRRWVGIAKKESSHYAKESNLGVDGGLRAIRTKSVPSRSRGHQINTATYIYDRRDQGGAVWYKRYRAGAKPGMTW